MPERPVIQALAERLAALVGGQRLAGFELLQFNALKTVEVPPDSLVGRELADVGQRGKYLVLDFAGPRALLHLSQAGRVQVEDPPKRTRPKRGVARLRFERDDGAGPALLVIEYGTERKAGFWLLAPGDEGPLAELGPEYDDPAFAARVREDDEDTRWLHTFLRDQRTVAGIGRGHADDVLHHAKLSPFVSLASLDTDERERLVGAIDAEMAAGLEAERAREGGLPPKLGDHWRVHARHGEPCPVCGEELQRVSYEAYEITYCPTCQTGGKTLADRRLSRLLK